MYNKLSDIQQTFQTFYTNLYTQPKTDVRVMEAFLNSINLPKVSDEQNRLLLVEITEEEIKKGNITSKDKQSPRARQISI